MQKRKIKRRNNMIRPFVAGNWKMNGSLEKNAELIAGLQDLGNCATEVVVCPPSIFIPQVAKLVEASNLSLGAQNVHTAEKGAFTGEISSQMLREFACEYVIIGHSERRQLFAETNELVAAKAQVAYDAGLKPILCVGETLAEREAEETFQIIEQQLAAVCKIMPIAKFVDLIIAYEPVWAIGTGKTASPEQAQEVHAHVRKVLAKLDASVATKTRIIYGGSVKAVNAADLFSQPDINGGLIGGASLQAGEFIEICKKAST
jgi:triosephosphate isomerase (TIM)